MGSPDGPRDHRGFSVPPCVCCVIITQVHKSFGPVYSMFLNMQLRKHSASDGEIASPYTGRVTAAPKGGP